MSERTFISYRRSDSAPRAKMIADALKQAHGEGTVFMDVESVAMGARWPDRIRAALAEAERVVVVIGRGWQYGRRRIDDPDDWVRLEISLALSDASKRVFPFWSMMRSCRRPR